MKKVLSLMLTVVLICTLCVVVLIGCNNNKKPNIGVSFGVGDAERWVLEKKYMEDYASHNDVDVTIRFNKTDTPKTQKEDCFELIDSGIDVLIYVPRNTEKHDEIKEIIDYAKSKKVKIISYARMIKNVQYDLFIGYDSLRIGEQMGDFVREIKRGNYVMIKGPSTDINAKLVADGIMKTLSKHISSPTNIVEESMRINFQETFEVSWQPEEAYPVIYDKLSALEFGTTQVILAPNDKLAGETVKALKALGYTSENMPIVTGMDAELDAIKRIINNEQTMTVYMNYKKLAEKTMELACQFARGEKVTPNDKIEINDSKLLDAFMITGDVITNNRDLIKKLLIDSGYYTEEEIYG